MFKEKLTRMPGSELFRIRLEKAREFADMDLNLLN